MASCERDGGTGVSCQASCAGQYPAGIELAETLNDCMTLQCSTDAGGNVCPGS